MFDKTACCWGCPFTLQAKGVRHRFQTVIPAKERVKKSGLGIAGRLRGVFPALRSVIPAKAGIHFRRWNRLLEGPPPTRGRRGGSIPMYWMPAVPWEEYTAGTHFPAGAYAMEEASLSRQPG